MFSTQTNFFGGMLNIPWRATMDLVTWDYIGDALSTYHLGSHSTPPGPPT